MVDPEDRKLAEGAARYADEDAEFAGAFLPLMAEALAEDWDSPEDDALTVGDRCECLLCLDRRAAARKAVEEIVANLG